MSPGQNKKNKKNKNLITQVKEISLPQNCFYNSKWSCDVPPLLSDHSQTTIQTTNQIGHLHKKQQFPLRLDLLSKIDKNILYLAKRVMRSERS